MSALPRHPHEPRENTLPRAGMRMTADEYLALGETDENYELIDGEVRMSPKPSRRHQKALCLIQAQFESFMRANPGFDYYPDVDIRFNAEHVFAPDMCCFRPGRLPPLDEVLTIAPDLVIEILSPANMAADLIKKRAAYARFGVPEYWVVDPTTGGVRCFRARDGEFEETLCTGASLTSEATPGFTLDLTPLRRLAQS